MSANGSAAVVAQTLGDQLAVLVQVFHAFGQHLHGLAVNEVFGAGLIHALRQRNVGRRVAREYGFIVGGHSGRVVAGVDRLVWWQQGVALAGLVNLHRFAVKVGVGKVVGGFAKVDQREVKLARVFMHTGAAPDDLLELGHAADFALQHDEPAGLRIHAGGKQARGSDDDGNTGLGVDKVAELLFAFGIVSGDAHHVARVFLHQVGVFVDEGLAHAGGVGGCRRKKRWFSGSGRRWP